MNNPFSLKNKTILVTGASSGIGRTTAIECSRLGATVYITGRNKERVMETFSQLEGKGHHQLIADLTDSTQSKMMVNALPEIDGIVHSAGVIPDTYIPAPFLEEKDVTEIIQSNLIQIIRLNALIFQKRKIKNGSSIVHLSSLIARHPVIGFSHYSMSKGALLSYSKTLAAELVSKSIRVNAVLPAMIDTEVIQTSFDKENLNNDRKRYPFGYGQPEDVAWTCIFLLSDAARWITGGEFCLDGGLVLK